MLIHGISYNLHSRYASQQGMHKRYLTFLYVYGKNIQFCMNHQSIIEGSSIEEDPILDSSYASIIEIY